MNPQPVKEEIIARYSSASGSDYLSYELENEAAFLKLQQLALEDAGFFKAGFYKAGFFKLEKKLFTRAANLRTADPSAADEEPPIAEPPSVLDVGCATGALLAFLRGRGWRVTGVEISPCAQYAKNERNLDVRTEPLEKNNFPESGFDAVLASHLIEHLNDPRSFLLETRRVLKNTGRVFITTPNISGLQARLYGGRWRSAIFDHLYLFSVRTLTALLKSTGFKVEKVSTWGGLAAGLAPKPLKKTADFLAKRMGFGDVMIVRAKKE